MNPLLSIRIPLANVREFVPDELWPALKRAAFATMRMHIPGLSQLKGTVPGLGVQAVGDQLHLCVVLEPHPQLNLKLADAGRRLGRIVELDPTTLDQATIKNSLLLTRELLAAAGEGEPASMKEWLGRVSEAESSRATNRLRRDLGRRYEIQVFEQPEVLMLPDVAATRVENVIRTLSVVVKEMKGQNSFRAAQLLQVQGDGGPVFSVDPRQVWSFIRRDHARTYRSGMKLHRSMARSTLVLVQGRLVIHELTDSPIAMEVDRMGAAG